MLLPNCFQCFSTWCK